MNVETDDLMSLLSDFPPSDPAASAVVFDRAKARIEELEALLRQSEVHLGGYMSSRYSDVDALRRQIRSVLPKDAVGW